MRTFLRLSLLLPFTFCLSQCHAWGFYGHKRINFLAVFLLPPEMIVFYKPHISFLEEHAVDPDKRRYAVAEEGPRHYIDMDRYGSYPFDALPRSWNAARDRYTADSLQSHGIVPWWIQTMLHRLTEAFRAGDAKRILKLSAELGHYVADAHVPLHTSSNHNGQYTNQRGIHGFWESRIPELLADQHWDFLMQRAVYLHDPLSFTWQRVLESALAADSVLKLEKELSLRFPPDQRYAFEERNGRLVRQYSTAYTLAYDRLMGGMVERRMRQSIFGVASFWYTAWINAGQPDLRSLGAVKWDPADEAGFEALQQAWKTAAIKGRTHE